MSCIHIINDMELIEIFLRKRANEIQHMIKQFSKLDNVNLTKIKYKTYDKILIEFEGIRKENILESICKSIFNFYKFSFLNSHLKDIIFDTYSIHALIGALISVDREKELNSLYFSVKNLRSISPESLIEFRHNNMQKNWNNLLELTRSLIKNLESKKELYELISYFIASKDNSPRVTLTDSYPINLIVQGNLIEPVEFTSNNELNILTTVLSENPSHIVIKNQDILSTELLEAFQALGQ